MKEINEQVKEAFKPVGRNKWHFINGMHNGKEVRLKFYVGDTHVDVQIFLIDGKAQLSFNYEKRTKTMAAILERLAQC